MNDMDELRQRRRVNELMNQLGFVAAEICSLHALLARACADRDRDRVKGLADDLVTRHSRFHEVYTRLLLADTGTRLARRMSS